MQRGPVSGNDRALFCVFLSIRQILPQGIPEWGAPCTMKRQVDYSHKSSFMQTYMPSIRLSLPFWLCYKKPIQSMAGKTI
jgi:hypothetical protein